MTKAQMAEIKETVELPSIPMPSVPIAEENTVQNSFGAIERGFHAWLGRMTMGMSPNAFSLAYRDWLEHLMLSPGKQMELLVSAGEHAAQLQRYAACACAAEKPDCCVEPDLIDRRFKTEEWHEFPYNIYQQTFLHYRNWWKEATESVRGVNRHNLDLVSFITRQMIDAIAPSNFIPTNPLLMKATQEQAGMNLLTGWTNLLEDMRRLATGKKPVGLEQFEVGKNLAITKGKVIFRNDLLELIQYEPTTKEVYAEPVFIVPAWIMKYYILDLSPHNSLAKYLVDQGHTVFMISWKNPTAEYRNVGLNDYLRHGLFEALEVAQNMMPDRKVHAVGYCLGGTLLSIAASWVGKRHKHPFKSVTLFTSQTDFTEPGELQLFVDESQLRFLEDIMQEQGYLDKHQMKGIFQWLRSNELIWSNIISNYLLGERALHNDLMAWNADATRMPYKMHSEYLRKLFLNNELAEGEYKVVNTTIALSDIDVPIFAVGTQWDHVAPWKSVYKIHLLTNTDVTFALTTGGHNAGIISEPGHPKRTYQVKTTDKNGPYMPPEVWQKETPVKDGSWWPAWQAWLAGKSSAQKVPSSAMGSKKYKSLCDAPGTYVMEG